MKQLENAFINGERIMWLAHSILLLVDINSSKLSFSFKKYSAVELVEVPFQNENFSGYIKKGRRQRGCLDRYPKIVHWKDVSKIIIG